jgi:hypothetical protein
MSSSWSDPPPNVRSQPRSTRATVPPRIGRVIASQVKIAAAPDRVWADIAARAAISPRAPFYLRLLLSGSTSNERVVWLYVSGTLVKQVQKLDRQRRYEFSVVGHDRTMTALTITTRFAGLRRPRWLLRPLENTFCRLFHRHVLRSIQRRAEA